MQSVLDNSHEIYAKEITTLWELKKDLIDNKARTKDDKLMTSSTKF